MASHTRVHDHKADCGDGDGVMLGRLLVCAAIIVALAAFALMNVM